MSTQTRTADQIHQDIGAAMLDSAGDNLPMDEWRQFHAAKTERIHALWEELAKVVAADRTAPPWGRLAVLLVRDLYAREMRDATVRQEKEQR